MAWTTGNRRGCRVVKRVTAIATKATVGGKNCNFRSWLELLYGCYLELLKRCGYIRDWDFEPLKFYFKGEKTAPIQYTPDFRVIMPDGDIIWHETKGYHDSTTNSKLRRLKKHYPSAKIELWLDGFDSKTAGRRRTAEKYCVRVGNVKPIFRKFGNLVAAVGATVGKFASDSTTNDKRPADAANVPSDTESRTGDNVGCLTENKNYSPLLTKPPRHLTARGGF